MPSGKDTTVPPGSTVLVTGASGFLATWICKIALEQGYAVRGTVRSASKGEYLVKLFGTDKFSYVIVEDAAASGAFDEASKGVDAVIHTATPFRLNFKHPDEMLRPAVEGTINMLKSVETNVKRIVITSSCASITPPWAPDSPERYSSADWNDASVELVKSKGKDADGANIYFAGKTLAERAAWDYMKDIPDTDLITVTPPFIFGPPIHECDSPDKLNESSGQQYNILYKGQLGSQEEVTTGIFSWVDVRDVALAHVKALYVREAAGKRLLLVNEPFTWQQFLDIAAKAEVKVPNKGFPGGSDKFVPPVVYDNSEVKSILGISFIDKEQNLRDTFAAFKQRGW